MKRHMLTVLIALVAGFMGAYAFALTDAETMHHSHGSDYFTDVAVDSPHGDDIGYAVEAGITMGLTPELYGSNVDVTREQMASFQMRDLAAAIVLAIQLERIQELQSIPPDPMHGMTWQEQADLCRWAALLLDHEAKARPENAIGGPEIYSYLSSTFRGLAQAIDPQFDTAE